MKFPSQVTPIKIASAIGSALLLTTNAHAGGTIKIDDTKWISLGVGLRTTFTTVENAANNGRDDSKDFDLEDLRVYINGQIHKHIQFEVNTFKNGSRAELLDSVVKFDYNGINLWMGRFLPPSDRANMSGPFYGGDWYMPVVSFGVAGEVSPVAAGRDDGVAIWGMAAGDRLKWKIGAFEGGVNGGAGSNGGADNLMYAGSLRYNFWDTEAGYYNASTYYGAKDILSIGGSFAIQTEAVSATQDYTAWHLDGLLEKNFNGHVATLETGFYSNDRDGGGTEAVFSEGEGYFVLGAYQLGDWKTSVRFQAWEPDINGAPDTERFDVGVDYIIDGHNARISLNWTDNFNNAVETASEQDGITLGVQIQL
jgi:hypothetical protein